MKIVKLLGKEIKDQEKGQFMEGFSDIAYLIRKGHDVCGDSVFIIADENKAVIAVLDGVSGEPDAEQASSVAALAMLNYLKNLDSISKDDIQEALVSGHSNIVAGFTTACIVAIAKSGKFVAGSVGDSTFYSLDTNGKVTLEMPPARMVGEGSLLSSFIPLRNAVPSALGLPGDLSIQLKEGKLEEGEMIVLATDALMDNMRVKIKDDTVVDASGVEEIQGLLKGISSPQQVIDALGKEVIQRMSELSEKKDGEYILVTKPDDLSLVIIKYRKS